MGFNIYIFIIAVIIVGLYFYMNKNKEKKHEEKRYDLIVIFKEEKYTDIHSINVNVCCIICNKAVLEPQTHSVLLIPC